MTFYLNPFEIFIGIKMLVTNDNQSVRTFDFHFEVCLFIFSSNFCKIVPLDARKVSQSATENHFRAKAK